jgi:hypothetical protein
VGNVDRFGQPDVSARERVLALEKTVGVLEQQVARLREQMSACIQFNESLLLILSSEHVTDEGRREIMSEILITAKFSDISTDLDNLLAESAEDAQAARLRELLRRARG